MKILREEKNGLFYRYLNTIFQHAGMRSVLAIILLIVLGLTEGVGLLMLIPFLQLIGIGDAAPTGIVATIGNVWSAFGLPLTLPAVLGVYAVIVSLYAFTQRFSTILNSKIAHSFTRKLRNDLFDAMSRMQWPEFMRIKTSDINHVLTTNLNTVDNGTFSVFLLVSTVFVVAVNILVAFSLSWPMTLVALVTSGLLLLILRPLNKQSYSLGEQWRSPMSDLFGVLMEHLGAMKLAKSFGAEEKHVESFCSLSKGLENQANKFATILATTQMYYEVGAVAVLGIFFYVAVDIFHMAAAKLLVMVFLFARLVPQFSWIQRTWQNILNMLPAFAAVENLKTQFRKSEEVRDDGEIRPFSLHHNARFENVSFKYDKSEPRSILNDLTMELPALQTTVIVGPSGGGKSTVADMLIGLLTPNSGTVYLDGKPLTGKLMHSWRRSVAYVPQESILFHKSIRDNLLWAKPDASEKDVWNALRQASADDFIARLPEGLDTIVGDRGVRMSGGERQRLALARALLRKPTLLLLDEATSQLDRENERKIVSALENLRGHMTVVFISHRMSAVKCADNILVIDRGRIVENGRREDLLKSKQGFFARMLSAENRDDSELRSNVN